MKNVIIGSGSGSFFVQKGQNTASVATKLTGTVSTSSGSNTITGIGTNFTSQLQAGSIVRITGVANTARVYLVTNTTSFISTFAPSQTVSGANAYIGLAAAAATTRLVSALKFSSSDIFSINAISIINPGYGYTTLPTITIVDKSITRLNIPCLLYTSDAADD
jgi:hypothetical protein